MRPSIKRLPLLLLLIGIGVATYFYFHSNKKNHQSDKASNGKDIPQEFFKRFEGTVSKQPVVVYLYRINEQIGGTYIYPKTGKLIYLNQQDASFDSDHIVFWEYYAEDTTEHSLTLHFEDSSTIIGDWRGNGKSLPIRLKEVYAEGSLRFDEIFTEDSLLMPTDSGETNTVANSYVVTLPALQVPISTKDFLLTRIAEYLGIQSNSSPFEVRTNLDKAVQQYLNKTSIIAKKATAEDPEEGHL